MNMENTTDVVLEMPVDEKITMIGNPCDEIVSSILKTENKDNIILLPVRKGKCGRWLILCLHKEDQSRNYNVNMALWLRQTDYKKLQQRPEEIMELALGLRECTDQEYRKMTEEVSVSHLMTKYAARGKKIYDSIPSGNEGDICDTEKVQSIMTAILCGMSAEASDRDCIFFIPGGIRDLIQVLKQMPILLRMDDNFSFTAKWDGSGMREAHTRINFYEDKNQGEDPRKSVLQTTDKRYVLMDCQQRWRENISSWTMEMADLLLNLSEKQKKYIQSVNWKNNQNLLRDIRDYLLVREWCCKDEGKCIDQNWTENILKISKYTYPLLTEREKEAILLAENTMREQSVEQEARDVQQGYTDVPPLNEIEEWDMKENTNYSRKYTRRKFRGRRFTFRGIIWVISGILYLLLYVLVHTSMVLTDTTVVFLVQTSPGEILQGILLAAGGFLLGFGTRGVFFSARRSEEKEKEKRWQR